MAESMYASIHKLQVKPGEERALRQALSQIEKDSDLIQQGVSSAYLIKSNDGAESFFMVVTFQNEDALKEYEQHRPQRMEQLKNLIADQGQRYSGEIVWTIEG